MRNRLICLALCLLTVASLVLTGCSGKTQEEIESNIQNEASASAMTLTMWLVSEKEVDADTASRITKAVNNITESKFKTRMKLYFLTDEEYRATMTETIRKREDSRSIFAENAATEVETETAVSGTVVDETETDKYGRVTIKYPDLKPNQVDILYIAGEDMLREYTANGWLKRLDDELNASSKKIKEYVSDTLLSAAKITGVSDKDKTQQVKGTYAIPNNNTIGEYRFMLLDKALMDSTNFSGSYKKGEIKGFFDSSIFTYLSIVRRADPEVLPVDASYEDMLDLLAHYWTIDPDTFAADSSKFSLLGYRYTDPKTLSKGQTELTFQNLFNDETFRKNYFELNKMRMDGGYFGEAQEGQQVAVKFEDGTLADYERYLSENSAYYPVIVKYPSVNVEDVFERMFGVCSYTVDLSRSMQILTYLTTNTDFRNLIQYGEEDVDYTKTVEDLGDGKKIETVTRIQDSYMMDIFKTGNAFIVYPDTEKMDADVWEIGKKQNREALIEPLLNFDFASLAKASGNASSASLTPDGTTGYSYNWTTGYSREVLSQNSYLKSWMDAADRTGNGVYVLHTCASNVSGNLSATVYYYNNHIRNAGVSVTNGNGAVNVAYTGDAGDGYEITIINFVGKKNSSKLDWTYTAGGSTAKATTTYRNAQINFDFLNTETYSVNLTANLTLSMIADNKAAIEWVNAQSKEKATLGWTVSDNSEGGKTYTYLVYAPVISKPYTVSVMPTGTDKTLNLAVNYAVNESGKLGDSDAKYALFLLTVRADSDVAVNVTLNGLSADRTEFESDPNLAFCGLLDVELVKYFDELTKKVETLVGSVDNVEHLEEVINDLGVLFRVPEDPWLDNENLQKFLNEELKTDEVKALAAELDLSHFYWSLLSATSTDTVTHKEATMDGENLVYKDMEKNPVSGEAYYYFKSPYSIYKSWVSAQ